MFYLFVHFVIYHFDGDLDGVISFFLKTVYVYMYLKDRDTPPCRCHPSTSLLSKVPAPVRAGPTCSKELGIPSRFPS